MAEPAIAAKGLTKRYGSLVAVDGLDLTVMKGETFALLGTNGAGKSTTIDMLTGVSCPTTGDASIMGDSIVTATARAKTHLNVAPQQVAVAPKLSVRENLMLIAGIYGQSGRDARANAARMETQFGLSDVTGQRARVLSGGMQRRLSIAMAMITDPQVLFLDEPTVGLDVYARHELWDVIGSVKGKVTIMLTTHYLEEVEALADRVGIMVDGKVVSVGTPAQLKEDTHADSLEDAFIALTKGARQ